MDRYPKSLSFPTAIGATTGGASQIPRLIVPGQGVLLFATTDAESPASFRILNAARQGLTITFSKDAVTVLDSRSDKPLCDPLNHQGLTKNRGAYYWFSLDYNNQRLYAGIGEARVETFTYKYTFHELAEQADANRAFLESLVTIEEVSATITPLRLVRDPVTYAIPLLVKEREHLTMRHIAEATFLPKANLSPIGQQLHDCIAGKRFVLDDAEFPDFSKAIEASIADGWCAQRLAEKATEFGPSNPKETYLRITLSQNNGESPGIPYVMEIWPPGHYSPVHNHAGSNAIIRVLHGSIDTHLYPYLCCEPTGIAPFATASFRKDDITWISPTLNQTHQLINTHKKTTCVTIQCYMYDEKDRAHYDYFDYVDSSGEKKQYEPDSDMEFVAFKELIRMEWRLRRQRTGCGCGFFGFCA